MLTGARINRDCQSPGCSMVKLPWTDNSRPLMLAPMQGLTHDALRASFMENYAPDVVFTEFVQVQARSRKRIKAADIRDINNHRGQIPLVVQLIGGDVPALVDAAEMIQILGCHQLNLNLGCPFGRMTTGATGGELLRDRKHLNVLLKALRGVIKGSFSVKTRAGYHDPGEIFELLPLYQDCGVDYLVFHPRTVVQKYAGQADHDLSRELARQAGIPVIVNGDIKTPADALCLLADSKIAGLMVGRGALADPLLFQRIRGKLPETRNGLSRRNDLAELMYDLIPRYEKKFCGERQALMKLKDLLNFVVDSELQRDLGKLKRATTLPRFYAVLEKYFMPQ